jgi:starch phosphorylase
VRPLLESGRLQLVFAGKAYPEDAGGQGLVHGILEMTRAFPGRVVFVPDYSREGGRALTRGCDVWLNTPRRPREASGTSGMKAALNGVVNVSTLDGWWAEACDHGVNGWQFGDGYEGPGQDEHDHEALLRVLENDVLPTFHENRAAWVAIMRRAALMVRTRFSAARMVSEYRERLHGA